MKPTEKSYDRYEHDILTEIATDQRVSQRVLSTRLGIALGLTNLLVRRVIRKGWVRVVHIRPNRVKYLLTPAGLAEKARMSRALLQDYVRIYAGARDRVRAGLQEIDQDLRHCENGCAKRVVFYGVGEVAEIAYICLPETGLTLVGAVGDGERRKFFDLPVHRSSDLGPSWLGATEFDRIVVTTLENRDALRAQLESRGVSADRVYWL